MRPPEGLVNSESLQGAVHVGVPGESTHQGARTAKVENVPLVGNGDTITTESAKRIASGIRSLTIQNIVNSVLGFVFLSLLLRLLSPSAYGLYSEVLLVTGIGSSVAFFGLQSAATRYVAFTAHDVGESRVVSRSIVVLSLAFASASTIVFVLLSPALSLYFTKSTSSAWIFAASGAWLFTSTISGIFQGLVQGMKKYESLAKVLVSSNLAMVSLTVLGLFELHSVIVPIVAWIFYGVLISVWSLAITRRPLLLAHSARTGRRTLKQVLRYSMPLGVAGIVTVATGAADPLVVGGLLNVTQLGGYYAAIAISGGLGVMLFTPLNTAFFPETSSNASDPKKLSAGLRLAFRYTALALVPVSFAVVGLSKQMIRLFSGGAASYIIANPSLQMMSFFFLFVAMQGILTSLLLSTGKTTQVMIIGVVTVVLDLALSVLLVPSFGILGAATSRILVDIAGFLMALYVTKKYLTGVADVDFHVKVFVASFIMLGVLFSLSKFVSNRTLTLFPYTLIGVIVFLLCARVFELLTEEDKRYLEHFMPSSLGRLVRLLL
ncbi:MAG: oligosaccharide flippase family protein [Thaumarchaeota archaeon]|nr:oligosaccharide flippase family protein [Nitrososphaerota archaeon]